MQIAMGIFSCFARPKVVDNADSTGFNIDGLDPKEGITPGGSPSKRRGAGAESLSGSPRKRLDYDSLMKSKQMPSGVGVELANARALVRALARKPESRCPFCRLTPPHNLTFMATRECRCSCYTLICGPFHPHTALHTLAFTTLCYLVQMHCKAIKPGVAVYMQRLRTADRECALPCRRHLSKLLILDGREKLEMWWIEEGYLTDLSSVLLVSLPTHHHPYATLKLLQQCA